MTLAMNFPILVRPDPEGGWSALSLQTCTIDVADTPQAAFENVVKLLVGELEDALEHSNGDVKAAMEMLLCFAPLPDAAMFFASPRWLSPLQQEIKRGRVEITFEAEPRQVAVACS